MVEREEDQIVCVVELWVNDELETVGTFSNDDDATAWMTEAIAATDDDDVPECVMHYTYMDDPDRYLDEMAEEFDGEYPDDDE